MSSEARISALTENMRFERKNAVPSREKAAYAATQTACEEALQTLSKLNLRLWHAVEESDYRSLPMAEVRALLEKTRDKIDAALEKCPRGVD